ncbi:MAG: radical SAM protein [Xanthomonadales bacterium]|nr:radical SAM protein [Gammaproteobacteria bacterium]MBT8052336.1 radical SAM protein [Gammaproteobacteria bacterium]NND56554.1 radical SAM protein [Xanthomonadales bacterium]NNK52547.1 radical SAM protein [Xanthomonadales bacterium]
MAGQISRSQPTKLLEYDLLLLELFANGAKVGDVVKELNYGASRQVIAAFPSAEAPRARITTLLRTHVLIPCQDGSSQSIESEQPVQRLQDCTRPMALNPACRLRIGANIALQPDGSAFRVWSAENRRYINLDLRLQLLLFSFRKETPVSRVLEEKGPLAGEDDCGKGIQWLYDLGLLYSIEDRPQMLVKKPAQDKPSESGFALRGSGPRWQDLEPDGRIPVYFTPHMENHYPLALGMIAAAIADFNEGELLKKFQLLPISFLTPQQLIDGPHRKFGPGIWLFSNYMWSLDVNLQISAMLKARDHNSLTLHGGPSTPGYPGACAEFMGKNPSVDIAVHGEGEVSVVEILQCIERGPDGRLHYDVERLKKVTGLTFRDTGQTGLPLVTTEKRTRLKEPDSVPSPYLTGVFDSYDGRVEAAIIESNRGCPFGCTFCDWGSATRQKVRKIGLDRVKQEIDWIGRNRVRVIWIADANFGMYDRDIELSEFIVETKQKYGFPQEVVVNYTKNTTRRLLEIIKALSAGGIISQGIISIQTTDPATLEVINRRNIKTEKYDELTQVFADSNLPLSTDLMTGLPGITPEAFDRDLQRYFDSDVTTKAYPTQLLPNSPMADPEYMEKYKIRVDKDGFVISCHSFNEAEMAGMNAIYGFFTVADGYSVLRYVLRYLQWEHGIPALEYLHHLLDETNSHPDKYPLITWVARTFMLAKFMPGGWKAFYDQVAAFTQDRYQIERDQAFDTVLLVNELAMPDDSLRYPLRRDLPHDFVAWFEDHAPRGASQVKRLGTYPPGVFEVDDPHSMSSIDMDYIQYDSHQLFWELRSSIARPASVSDVKELAQRRLAG